MPETRPAFDNTDVLFVCHYRTAARVFKPSATTTKLRRSATACRCSRRCHTTSTFNPRLSGSTSTTRSMRTRSRLLRPSSMNLIQRDRIARRPGRIPALFLLEGLTSCDRSSPITATSLAIFRKPNAADAGTINDIATNSDLSCCKRRDANGQKTPLISCADNLKAGRDVCESIAANVCGVRMRCDSALIAKNRSAGCRNHRLGRRNYPAAISTTELPLIEEIIRRRARASLDMTVPMGTSVASAISR